MRAVLDPNILIAALLSPSGAPARLLRAWQEGAFELLVSPLLLSELERALAYPKVAERIRPEEAELFLDWLGRHATEAGDASDPPPVRSADPEDDYLIALAFGEGAALVSGDRHLLDLRQRAPIFSAAEFLRLLLQS